MAGGLAAPDAGAAPELVGAVDGTPAGVLLPPLPPPLDGEAGVGAAGVGAAGVGAAGVGVGAAGVGVAGVGA